MSPSLKNSNMASKKASMRVNRAVFAVSGRGRDRCTVVPAFRHTLYLPNIWPAYGS